MAASGVSQSYEKGGDDSTHAVSAFFTLARLYTLTAGRPTLEFSAFERDGVRGYEFIGTGSYGGLLAGHRLSH